VDRVLQSEEVMASFPSARFDWLLACLVFAIGCGPHPPRMVPDAAGDDGGPITIDSGPDEDAGPIGDDAGTIDVDAGSEDLDGGPVVTDAAPADAGPSCEAGVRLDLLFMVDNSNSMTEEQASLAAQFPRLMRVLASGDLDGDGSEDFPPVADMHVGVVTADMGTAGFIVPTCADPSVGDDGILRTEGNTAIAGCAATHPAFLAFGAGDDTDALAGDFTCVAQMGTGGCGFEQQLEATLKALTPSSSSLRFHAATRGHADGANAGFLRGDSLVGVVMLTDENDCSASDGEIFNPSSATYSGNLNLRCFSYPSALHPVTRYVAGLQAAVGDPARLVFAAITGVPVDLVSDPSAIDYDAILAEARMRETVDVSDPNRLTPSCNVPGRGLAFPPRRIVQTARDLELAGSGTIVQSICQADFTPALDAIITRLADRLPNCD